MSDERTEGKEHTSEKAIKIKLRRETQQSVENSTQRKMATIHSVLVDSNADTNRRNLNLRILIKYVYIPSVQDGAEEAVSYTIV